jgi:hypothetical protein
MCDNLTYDKWAMRNPIIEGFAAVFQKIVEINKSYAQNELRR